MRMVKVVCILMVALCLCIVPVAAEDTYPTIIHLLETSGMSTEEHVVSGSSQVFTAPDGYVIIGFEAPLDCGDHFNYTAYYGDETISGSFVYEDAGLLGMTGTLYGLTLNAQTFNETVGAVGYRLPERFVFAAGWHKDGHSENYSILDRGFVSWTPEVVGADAHPADHYLFESAQSVAATPIWKVAITNATYNTYVYTCTDEDWATYAGKSIGYSLDFWEEQSQESADLLDAIWGFAGTLWMIILVAKYFFIDHFFELVVLYEVVIMAYTAQGSRDIISFLRKFVRAQTKLFGAVLRLLEMLVNIVVKLIPGL